MDQEWLNELLWKNMPQWRKDQLNKEREDVETFNFAQQLKAEIAAVANEIEMDIGLGRVTQRRDLLTKLRQLSAI
jgi:adenosyl cobinamide kinase/adenosyl cobinamide phosphate guanylyltransferase